MTAEEVIDDARGFHESFSPDQHTRKLCLQELRRAEPRFFRLMSEAAPDSVAQEVVYVANDILAALDGTPLAHGESDQFPPYTYLIGAVVVTGDGLFPCDLITDERSGGQNRFRVRVMGQQLYITQPAAVLDQLPDPPGTSPWEDVLALRLTYVPYPARITLLADELTAPERAKDFLVGALVVFMATRAPKGTIEPADKRDLIATGTGLQGAVIESATKAHGAEERWYVSKVG